LDEVDSLHLAAIDPKVPGTDAVALPDPQRLGNDLQVTDPGLPPPAGVTFDIDERGLVRATPEGAITPDGFRVYTGRPPAVPPERGAATAAVAAPIEAPAREALAAIRPKARPSDLTEQRERATLGGISLQELAAIRPVLRPRTAQEEALQEQPDATAQAVRRSLIPVARPRNMAAIVERAEKTPQPVQTAAVAPRTVNPSIPSNASVSRAATVNNAINLNKINLIGVFGTPSNRRALVRLPNGRYQKVKIGDRLDGGRVATISESELRYTKRGRNVTLKMPRS
jgi:Tfp pilus assembly protein PilP